MLVTRKLWGNSSCPFGTTTIYRGVASGGYYNHDGTPANLMCLPPDPVRPSNNLGGSIPTYTVEYQTGGSINHANDRNVPCAVCEVSGKTAILMIPSHKECPTGWRHEYSGYIMAGHNSHKGSSMFNCIDISLEQIPGTGGDDSSHQLYPIYAASSQLPRDGSYALTCVVCSK
ncbi:uncharacterized protein [Dysidea avara]|uniref:uncharacterized protein n=1 Tax=Dysidea avara TaxID=196820 RepID=UPI003322C41B